MLIFWNLAGVPLSYCHCTLYLANHAPSVYHWNPFALTLLYASYLFVYWVWDTCNSQKNNFRQQERGTFMGRKAFPQLPWRTIKNPKIIKTDTGDSILVDGWCKHILCSQLSHLLVLRVSNKLLIQTMYRPICPENKLHWRPLLRPSLGLNHRVQQSLSMVLPIVFCLHDFASSTAGHSKVSAKVRRGLGRVYEARSLSLHTSKSLRRTATFLRSS